MIDAPPVRERPADRASASEWISVEHGRKEQTAELAFAQRDTKRCAEGTPNVLECLEMARAEIPFTRNGTRLTRSYWHATLEVRG